MKAITLRGYKTNDFEYHGHLPSGTQIKLDNKFSYNVRYGKDKICVATLDCSIFDKEDASRFGVHVVLEGMFSYEDGHTREELHVLTYKELFPYARAVVSAATALFGIQPITLPQVDIENQSIYRIDTGNLPK